MSPRRLLEGAWIGSGCLLFAGLVWQAMAILGDGFWCLATGDVVLRDGALPAVDTLSFASRHVPWVLHMVAFQVGGAWLVAHAGLSSLMVASALPVAVAAALLWLVPARGTWARMMSLPVVVLYLLVDQDDLSARGQAFGDLGLVVLLLLVARLRAGRRLRAWWALGLGAAWASVHPSFLLVAALPVAFALAERLEAPQSRARSWPLLAFAGLGLAGSCLNPSPGVLVLDVVKLLLDPTTATVDLFQSPDFHAPGFLVPVALGVALLVVLARSSGRGRADAAMLLGMMAAACLARRYVTALVAFEAVLVGQRASSASPVGAAQETGRILAAAIVLQTAAAVSSLERKDPLRDVPAEAVAAVDAMGLPDRVLAPYHWGGYLEWAWRGRRKAFVDGRNQLFSNGVLDDALRIEHALPGASALLDAYEIRTVIAERGSELDAALSRSDAWREVHRDRLTRVFTRP